MHVEGCLSLRMSTWNPAAGFIIPVAAPDPVLRDETGAKSAVADLRYGEGGRTLFLVKKRQVRFIPSALHFLD